MLLHSQSQSSFISAFFVCLFVVPVCQSSNNVASRSMEGEGGRRGGSGRWGGGGGEGAEAKGGEKGGRGGAGCGGEGRGEEGGGGGVHRL